VFAEQCGKHTKKSTKPAISHLKILEYYSDTWNSQIKISSIININDIGRIPA